MPQTKAQKRKGALEREIECMATALKFGWDDVFDAHLPVANNLRRKLGQSGWSSKTQFREWLESENPE